MSKLQLDLLRHGVTTAGNRYIGRTDPLLTQEGWQQMEMTVTGGGGWSAIITSPLQRCRLFAEKLAQKQGCQMEVMDNFSEFNFGVMEGLTAQEVIDQYPGVLDAFWQDPLNNPPPEAEHLARFQQRVLNGVGKLMKQYEGQHVLLVCHGGVIRAMKCLEQGVPVNKLLQFSAAHGDLHSFQIDKNFQAAIKDTL